MYSMDRKDHWEGVYTTKSVDEVGWFRKHLERSLEMVEAADLAPDARIIDVGGGASTFVDDMVERGYTNLTVLDISSAALEKTKKRLGEAAENVDFVTADITQADLPQAAFDLWHDRAVFHFLTSQREREAYLANLKRALKPGGHFVIAIFADDGPIRCSGLDVERYDLDKLVRTVGPDFRLIDSIRDEHETPFGSVQSFLQAHFAKST